MPDIEWTPQPYEEAELLSFDRLKRAVMSRVVNRIDIQMGIEFPISPEHTIDLITDEWKRAKDAVYKSPRAREMYRKYLESMISEKIDAMIRSDKDELSHYGVAEKSI